MFVTVFTKARQSTLMLECVKYRKKD